MTISQLVCKYHCIEVITMTRTLLLLLLSTLLSFAGENLIKNADFKLLKDNGVPQQWSIHPHTAISQDGEWLTLQLDDETKGQDIKATLVQSFAPNAFQGGNIYSLTCLFKAAEPCWAEIYVEGYYLKDGKRQSARAHRGSVNPCEPRDELLGFGLPGAGVFFPPGFARNPVHLRSRP